MEPEIVALVERFRAGDEAAAEELWACYSSGMLVRVKALLRSVGNRGAFDSEGIVNSGYRSFFSAIKKPDFDLRSKRIGGLLATIVARKAYAKLRRKYPADSSLQDHSTLREATSAIVDYTEPEAETDLREIMFRVVADMTEREQQALDLYLDRDNEYSVSDIAKQCRRTVTTIEDIIQRFESQLRDELRSHETDIAKET